MNGLYPIIRRARRPLLLPDEPATKLPVPESAAAAVVIPVVEPPAPPIAPTKKAHASRALQTAAAS